MAVTPPSAGSRAQPGEFEHAEPPKVDRAPTTLVRGERPLRVDHVFELRERCGHGPRSPLGKLLGRPEGMKSRGPHAATASHLSGVELDSGTQWRHSVVSLG